MFTTAVRQTTKRLKTLTPRQYLYLISSLVFVVLLFTDYSPLHPVKKFFVALLDVVTDFDLSISREIKDCRIFLWTRRNPTEQQVFTEVTAQALSETYFNRSHPTKILLHGFSDSASTSWTRDVRNSYLRNGDYNVFSVDWEKLAKSPWYTTAVKNARHVGQYAANLVHLLVSDSMGVPWSSLHVIGASLGGQAAGHVGYFTGGKLPRITGLDPSGPLFHAAPPELRLDSSDAQFVDVIHSAGKWVGDDDVIGHADFFPNGGRAPQPGCEERESLDLTCSHFRSWQMFSHSINSEVPYYAMRCDSLKAFASGKCCMDPRLNSSGGNSSVVVMGDAVDSRVRGKFYLVTKEEGPMKSKQESVDCKWVL